MCNPIGERRDRRPSLADVARHVGVSVTTASHALSGKRPVAAETVRAIEEAIDELGYTPNRAATTLALGATRTIGLVVPDISNPFFALLAKGVEDAAEVHGFNLILANTDFDHQREDRALRMVSARAIDGLIYAAGALPQEGTLPALMAALPVAIIDEELPVEGVLTVASDNERGGQLVADHLADLGHRDVLVLTGPEGLPTSSQRSAALRRGHEQGRFRIVERTADYSGALARVLVADELREHGTWFTAIYAHNDLSAISAIDVLAAHGIAVPREVSVVGFDDIPPASLICPTLTTVHQPVHELGWAAAENVIALLQTEDGLPAHREIMPVELRCRESTAPARHDPQASVPRRRTE